MAFAAYNKETKQWEQTDVDPEATPAATAAANDYKSQQGVRAQAAGLWDAKTALAGKQLGDWTSQRGQGQQALQAAGQQGLTDIAQQGAESRANAAAAGGGSTASVYGGLLAAGKQIGQDQATYRAKAAQDLAGYATDTLAGTQERQANVQDTGLQALQAKAAMGTETENSQKRLADLQSQVAKEEDNVRKNGATTGEQAAYAHQLYLKAQSEPDQMVRQWLLDEADRVASGYVDV